MTDILAFNRWDCSGVKVEDPGLKDYITVTPTIVPRTGARYAGNRFHKSKVFIVERLINKVMIPGRIGTKKHKVSSGHITGKAATAYGIVLEAFEIIEQKTKTNPIEIFVKALENGAPREEIITIEYGGARYPKPVECAPQRRIDRTLKFMTQGAYKASFNKKKSMSAALAQEIMDAHALSTNSLAISKKLETERQSDSSR
ncbi:30S ribosomal protein S7 [Candidatus Woesearchaeota archaeon]|nr:30S ribosomal protein S7 [Candidatus Woesearchaeota archaeon]